MHKTKGNLVIEILLTMRLYKIFFHKNSIIGRYYYGVTQKRQILSNVSNSDDRCLIQSVIWWDLTGGVELDYTLSRSLTISNFLNRKWAAEVEHFRPRPLAQSKIGDSSLSFSPPRLDAILGEEPFLSSSLPNPNARLRRAFRIGEEIEDLASPIINFSYR